MRAYYIKKYTRVIKYKSHTFHPLEISIISHDVCGPICAQSHRKPWWKLMYVGLTQAGPEKPGQPCTHTKKKSGILQGTNCEFLFKTQKNKEKVFIAKSFFPLSYMYQSITSYTVKTHIKNLCFEGSGWFCFYLSGVSCKISLKMFLRCS